MDRYSRIKKIIDSDSIEKLQSTKVLIVGIGGVGGSCFEMLVRTGISNISIIDFDVFEESNLNRQILSLETNIGKSKVDEAKERANLINHESNIKTYKIRLDESTISKLETDYDYIIDACDDINAKILLVKFAIKNDIKIISSCGTGNRVDPSKLSITNIWKTENDPLAKKLRYELRKENIKYKLPAVFSKEIPLIKQSGFVGSIAMVPNAAGILLASFVIKDIMNK